MEASFGGRLQRTKEHAKSLKDTREHDKIKKKQETSDPFQGLLPCEDYHLFLYIGLVNADFCSCLHNSTKLGWRIDSSFSVQRLLISIISSYIGKRRFSSL